MRKAKHSERGHVGSTTATLLAIAATVVLAVGLGKDSHAVEITGVILFGAAFVLATQVPHLWLRKMYRRLDRITDESDPDRHAGFRIEL
ncbi:MAG TPA: hypothetical protein VEZ14_14765 [Dehalococcoidia bacterium]|nr:hypothetical protein [Dehalococcoidia bacterium]